MHRDLKRALGRVKATYRALRATARRNYVRWGRLRSHGDWPDYVTAIEQEDWNDLARRARASLTRNQRALRQLLAERGALARRFAASAEIAVAYQKHSVAPRSRPDWDELRSRVVRGLRQRRIGPAASADLLARLESADASTVPRALLRGLRARDERLELFAQRATAAVMGAHLAQAVAALNLAARRGGRASAAAAFARRTIRAVEAAERGFHRALSRGRVPSVSAGHEAKIERSLREAAAWAARVAAARRAGRAADDRAALLLGDALRALLRHAALCYRLAWVGAADPDSPARTRWLRAAGRPFPTAWRDPRERSLEALASRPRSVANRSAVTLVGTLGPVTIRHVGPDPVSTAVVSDRTGRFDVPVTAKHRKFDSSGMVGGSAVSVSGEWEHRAAETATPALRLGRRRLAELAVRSWSDWVTAELREVYEPTPQALTIRWSWEPGRDGAGNPLRYRVWCPEERSATT
jgi:hypothetical protein